MNEWGTPDWRDAAAYGDVKRWRFDRWRWEFYRRRDDLRAYFDAHVEETLQRRQRYAGKDGFTVAHLRPNEPGFTLDAALEAGAQFGYSSLPNPRIGAQPMHLIKTHQHDGVRYDLGGVPFPLAPHEEPLTFDLDRPIEPQLAHAREVLLSAQYALHGKPLQKRRRPKKWLGYLRALDAREAGASWAEITGAFYAEKLLDRHKDPSGGYCAPPPQAARDMWLAADALRFKF
ncbi:hypothetical protein ACUJ46_09030 [Sandaracinobacteroides sp. A072]|uniref:hypothetical protein n=1 Tax=Sandaracinobacteroides sp. A072 TaxID=3461146 RepID=UPI00404172C2